MKRSRTLITTAVTVAVVGIAVWALAGYFLNDGRVKPPEGCADDTTFHWYVEYQLEGEEDPPDVHVAIYDGGDLKFYEMMAVVEIDSGVVRYSYQRTLTLPDDEYLFRFETFFQHTNTQFGPDVYNCP